MAGDEEAKKKGEKKEKKEKPEKEKGEKKEKKEKDPEKKEKSSKSAAADAAGGGGEKKVKSDKKKDKDVGEGPSTSGSSKPKPGPAPAPARGGPGRGPAKPSNDYLAGIDLPSSDDDEDEYERVARTDDDANKAPIMTGSSRETKKIADKERKAMEAAVRAKEDALREDENVFDVAFEGMGEEVSATATDVKVHNLTIRAKGKLLLENTSLTVAAGRRYGLVGPNGRGKSTLLRLMARRQIPVPLIIDVLLVEQEIVGDERWAVGGWWFLLVDQHCAAGRGRGGR